MENLNHQNEVAVVEASASCLTKIKMIPGIKKDTWSLVSTGKPSTKREPISG